MSVAHLTTMLSGTVFCRTIRLEHLWAHERSAAAAAARTGQAKPVEAPAASAAAAADAAADEDDDDSAEDRTAWSLERRTAEELVQGLVEQWQAPMDALANAGKAFEGLEALLGGASGGSFDLKVWAWWPAAAYMQCARMRIKSKHNAGVLGGSRASC